MILDSLHEPSDQIGWGDIPASFLRDAYAAGSIALDLETTGLNWDSDHIALCQAALPLGKHIVFRPIIPPPNLMQVISDAGVRKIFHHAMFDLRFMSHHWGVVPRNVACTKIASKLLFPDSSNHSLKTLLAEHLEVVIDKSLQKSDWGRTELSQEQLAYAVTDVIHLPALLDRLASLLRQSGLHDLYERCLDHIPTRVQLELRRYSDIYTY